MKAKLIELLFHCGVEATFAEYERIARELIANGVTVQKWIPVTERLPHELLTVIIAVPNGKRTDVMPAYLANGWWKASNDWCYEKDKVSHWMPLPEPPKGE